MRTMWYSESESFITVTAFEVWFTKAVVIMELAAVDNVLLSTVDVIFRSRKKWLPSAAIPQSKALKEVSAFYDGRFSQC